MGEKLVQCGVRDLVNVPDASGDLAHLQGTPKQVNWAETLRQELRARWRPYLSGNVFLGLATILDATWWIANKDSESSEIKWPESWLAKLRPAVPQQPPPSSPPQSPGKTLCQVFKEEERVHSFEDLERFEEFARKAAKSPEMAYLTIIAMLYRHTKDRRVLAWWRASRDRVNAHLDAIDLIVGE